MKIGLWLTIVAVMAMTTLTSCRKTPAAPQSFGEQQPNTVRTQPQSVPQTNVTHSGPELAQSDDERSCKEFVQDFYDWYVHSVYARECKESPEDQDCKEAGEFHSHGEMSVKSALSPKLQRLLDEENAADAKEDGVGYLDFDPYLASQDPSPKFRVESVRVQNDRCDAEVHGFRGGTQQEKVMPELARTKGKWVFVNFHYGEGDDLVTGLTQDLKGHSEGTKNAKK